MTDTASDIERRRFPWARTRFELIGAAIAIGAWLAGILLGMLWGPLFWIGAAAAVVTLMATRQSERTPPMASDVIVAPVDGVVVSVEAGLPPVELRLSGQTYQRIRIASSPAAMNGLHAPIAGEIASIVTEEGEPSAPFAWTADGEGNAVLYLGFTSEAGNVGVVVVGGGLGPMIDMDLEVGDLVRVGRKVGARRLGGWCDVWLPADQITEVWPGMRVNAAETALLSSHTDGAMTRSLFEQTPETDIVDVEVDEPEAPAEPKATESDTQDPSEMFARLREKVSAASQTPDSPEKS